MLAELMKSQFVRRPSVRRPSVSQLSLNLTHVNENEKFVKKSKKKFYQKKNKTSGHMAQIKFETNP